MQDLQIHSSFTGKNEHSCYADKHFTITGTYPLQARALIKSLIHLRNFYDFFFYHICPIEHHMLKKIKKGGTVIIAITYENCVV